MNKSMLASKNLPKPVKNRSEGQHWIRVLAADLALRLNDARQMSPNLWPKTLVLHANEGALVFKQRLPSRIQCIIGYKATRSKQAPFPFTKDVTVDTIATAGNKLWNELFGHETTLNVTKVHLAFTGIEFSETGQQTIEGFLKPSSSRKRAQDEEKFDTQDVDARRVADAPHENAAYVCPRCGKTFYSPCRTELFLLGENGAADSDYLSRVKLEHEDYHFAQDLANEGRPRSRISVSKPQNTTPASAYTPKKQRSAFNPGGIEKFFRKS